MARTRSPGLTGPSLRRWRRGHRHRLPAHMGISCRQVFAGLNVLRKPATQPTMPKMTSHAATTMAPVSLFRLTGLINPAAGRRYSGQMPGSPMPFGDDVLELGAHDNRFHQTQRRLKAGAERRIRCGAQRRDRAQDV